MTKKLEHAQKVLAGLTSADFEMVKKHAEAMQVISYLEGWDRADLGWNNRKEEDHRGAQRPKAGGQRSLQQFGGVLVGVAAFLPQSVCGAGQATAGDEANGASVDNSHKRQRAGEWQG
jgi:hypothetical protein